MKPQRFAVIGAGAMGALLGARLTEAGVPTTLVDVSASRIQALNEHGVRIVDAGGTARSVPVDATADPGSVGAVDAAIFFVKCYQTEAAATFARPLVARATAVVSLQNGLGNEDVLARHYGQCPIVAGVTYDSATIVSNGTVLHAAAGPTVIGPHEGVSVEPARSVGEALERAGIDVTVTAEVRTEMWKKLVLNAATLPTAALVGMTIGQLGLAPMGDLVMDVARETVRVARVGSHDIDLDERLAVIAGILDRARDGKGSMLQDLEANRRTEIDVITGAVVREADALDVEAPLNRSLYALIRSYELAHGLT